MPQFEARQSKGVGRDSKKACRRLPLPLPPHGGRSRRFTLGLTSICAVPSLALPPLPSTPPHTPVVASSASAAASATPCARPLLLLRRRRRARQRRRLRAGGPGRVPGQPEWACQEGGGRLARRRTGPVGIGAAGFAHVSSPGAAGGQAASAGRGAAGCKGGWAGVGWWVVWVGGRGRGAPNTRAGRG